MSKPPKPETGASLVEYALLLGLIAFVCLVALSFVGPRLSHALSSAGASVGSSETSHCTDGHGQDVLHNKHC